MSTDQSFDFQSPSPRRRLTKAKRLRQLLDVAWQIVAKDGTEALALGRLSELAGVTKPVVYGHFTSRTGLLVALYRDYEARQTLLLTKAVELGEPTLRGQARVIADTYVECVVMQGREIPGVIAALATTPLLEEIRSEYETIFFEKCRRLLTPYIEDSELSLASLHAMLGAAQALSSAASKFSITTAQAKEELQAVITNIVTRNKKSIT